MRCGLFLVEGGDAPEADEDGFLAEGDVVEGAVNGVAVVGFGVLVAGDDFKLGALGTIREWTG